MSVLEGTIEEIEEESYAGCIAFLNSGGSKINTVNKALGQLLANEHFAEAAGIRRAMFEYMSDKIIICIEEDTMDDLQDKYNNLDND